MLEVTESGPDARLIKAVEGAAIARPVLWEIFDFGEPPAKDFSGELAVLTIDRRTLDVDELGPPWTAEELELLIEQQRTEPTCFGWTRPLSCAIAFRGYLVVVELPEEEFLEKARSDIRALEIACGHYVLRCYGGTPGFTTAPDATQAWLDRLADPMTEES